VNVRIIDLCAQQDKKTKAIGMQKSSFKVLPTAVVRRIQQESCKVQGFRIHEVVGNQRTELVHLRGADVPIKCEYNQMECIEQWKSERFLEDHLKGLGVAVERGTKLADFEQKWDHVDCDLEVSGATKKLKVGFLVGCDGGASLVRKKLGYEFQGSVAKESFVSAHCYFENQVGSAGYAEVFFGKNASGADPMAAGMCVSLPLHDGEHLINIDLDASQQERYVTDEVDPHGCRKLKQLTREDIVHMFRARSACPELTVPPERVTWISHYRVNSRLSEHFGSGRVYLAGDACHCHSPVGGQGMNMGIQDAKNLSWKLAAVVNGTADHSLLLSYEEERRDIDAKITKGVHFATSAFSNRNPLAFFLRGRPQRALGALVSMVPDFAKTAQGWSYGLTSSLAHEHWERPTVWATLKDVCRHPTRVYRRRQNLHRWSSSLGTRLSAGDMVPPVLVNDEIIYDVIRSSPGWTLLMFEGDVGANAEALANGLPVLSYDQLQAVGRELRQDDAGFIDKFVVFTSSDWDAHSAFGVQGQCLFVIRPDAYVGLRSEPVRQGAVTRYFRSIGGLGVPAHQCPSGTSNFDALPATMFLVLLSVIAVTFYAQHAQ